ncbi:solute carrier family 28 member 3-like isoform X2 [Babylonia areolata]|uniref:solute carrier family 28 member 3-like isoform X2 n=1 Tax=Babylonia areolata TaxID=304850 RepID=UPI003FD6AAD8
MSSLELKSFMRLEDRAEMDETGSHLDSANHVVGIPSDKRHVNNTCDQNDTPLRHRPSNTNPSDPADPTTVVDTTSAAAAAAAATSMDEDKDLGSCARSVSYAQRTVVDFVLHHQKVIVHATLLLLLLLYLAYFVYALRYRFGDEGSVRLLVGTLIAVVLLVIHLTWDCFLGGLQRASSRVSPATALVLRRRIRWLLYVVSVVVMVTLLIVLVALETPNNLISLAGLAAFIFLSWVTSIDPARVNWHPVFWGFSLQFYFACIILRTKGGYQAFKWLGEQVTTFIAYSEEGAAFVFGTNFRVHFFAFALRDVRAVLPGGHAEDSVCPGSFPWLLSWDHTCRVPLCRLQHLHGHDAPLMVRPFLSRMTKSELHAIMTGGFATIAGSVLGAYIGFGVPANHLLSASVMSAPAALAISKLTYPETEPLEVQVEDYNIMAEGTETNLIEAASAGATYSLVIVGSVVVNVIAFLSLLKFVNATLTWFGDRAGVENLTFELICSYLLYPVALFMGTVPGPDCRRVGELVGIKTFTNEFIAYEALQKLLINRQTWANYSQIYDVHDPANVVYDDLDVNLTRWNVVLEKGFLSPRSEVIATYALCGFSNFGSMGILLGGMSAMAPERRTDLSSIVLRAMIAGNIACFFTACIAGLFFQEYD